MATAEQPTSLRKRYAQSLVEETLEDTPITVIQGARQVGKSTLVRQVVANRDVTVLSLDATATYNAAKADPDAFVRQSDGLLVIDEVQRAPELVRAMKDAVEEDRRPGRFLVTGSADLLQIPGTEESLAGRAETVVLYGLSQGELSGHREDFMDHLLAGNEKALRGRAGTLSREEYLEAVCGGSYPEPLTRAGRRRNAWFDNYVKRIMTHDVQDRAAWLTWTGYQTCSAYSRPTRQGSWSRLGSLAMRASPRPACPATWTCLRPSTSSTCCRRGGTTSPNVSLAGPRWRCSTPGSPLG